MGKILPIPFDFLTRPVKYVEPLGVFVCAGYRIVDVETSGRNRWVIYRGDVSGEDRRTTWSKVFDKVQNDIYLPWAGAYGAVGANPATGDPGNPTFVMVGQEHHFSTGTSDPPFSKISILTSHDGDAWNETFSERDGFGYAAAWDETHKRFLVQSVVDIEFDAFNHAVFASPNGSSWSRIETKPGFEAGPEPQPSALMTATGTPLVKDVFGNIVPNGSYFGLDGTLSGLNDGNVRATIIAPKVLHPYYGSAPDIDTEFVAAVEIIKRRVDPETGAVTTTRRNKSMPFPVASVTYSGGVYQACGGTVSGDGTWEIASSNDDGETWNIDLSLSSHQAVCVMAKPVFAK